MQNKKIYVEDIFCGNVEGKDKFILQNDLKKRKVIKKYRKEKSFFFVKNRGQIRKKSRGKLRICKHGNTPEIEDASIFPSMRTTFRSLKGIVNWTPRLTESNETKKLQL